MKMILMKCDKKIKQQKRMRANRVVNKNNIIMTSDPGVLIKNHMNTRWESRKYIDH